MKLFADYSTNENYDINLLEKKLIINVQLGGNQISPHKKKIVHDKLKSLKSNIVESQLYDNDLNLRIKSLKSFNSSENNNLV